MNSKTQLPNSSSSSSSLLSAASSSSLSTAPSNSSMFPDNDTEFPPRDTNQQNYELYTAQDAELDQPFLKHHNTSFNSSKKRGDYDKYVLTLPNQFENFFRNFDDLIIQLCQRTAFRPVVWACVGVTAFTAIEPSVAIPYMLYMVGWDGIATHWLWLILVLMFVSQLPKRFLWRSRPHMVDRAKRIRKDKTSSFPSRAVTCAVVYSYALMFSVEYEWLNPHTDDFVFHWWIIFPVIVAALIASFARITVGAHYPSDCIFGFLQVRINLICPSCKLKECYATNDSFVEISYHNFASKINWIILIGGFLFFFLLAFLSVIRPLRFWVKCHLVYGLLFPPLLFKMLFICPPLIIGQKAALPPPVGPPAWYSFIFALVMGTVLLGGGMLSKKYPLVIFSCLFIMSFLSLFLYRLGHI